MGGESLKELGKIVQAAIVEGVNAPGVMASLSVYNLSRLVHVVQCYGGKEGWQPTPENVEKLAPAVRRYVRELEARIDAKRPARRIM